MKIIFFGTPQFAVPSLERLIAQPEFTVLAVVTQPDKRRGRGNQLVPSPVKTVAIAHEIPVWQPQRVKKDKETLASLQSAQADAFVVVAYGQILSQAILDMPRLGCVNGHGSILPKYRGAAPIQWCLYHGEPETGMTTMLMDAGMDTGAMLLKARTPIGLWDTAHDVAIRLAALSADLLVETLFGLEQGTIQPVPQMNEDATYAPLIQKADYELDWSRSAIALHNQIRGFFPNCTTRFRADPLKVIASVPLGEDFWSDLPAEFSSLPAEWAGLSFSTGQPGSIAPGSIAPGSIVAIAKNLGPIVQTGDGLLLLRDIQLSGKRPQSGTDFVNGARVTVGDRLGG